MAVGRWPSSAAIWTQQGRAGGAKMKLSGARAEFRRALRDFRPSRIKVGGGGAGPDRPALVTWTHWTSDTGTRCQLVSWRAASTGAFFDYQWPTHTKTVVWPRSRDRAQLNWLTSKAATGRVALLSWPTTAGVAVTHQPPPFWGAGPATMTPHWSCQWVAHRLLKSPEKVNRLTNVITNTCRGR